MCRFLLQTAYSLAVWLSLANLFYNKGIAMFLQLPTALPGHKVLPVDIIKY